MLALKFQDNLLEVGTDEAGRGCLSGPVVAAAVILPDNFSHPLLNDSKQLTEKQRQLLRPYIEKNALSFSVGFVYQEKIDALHILHASILALHPSIEGLAIVPEFIIVDGNKFNTYKDISHKTIVKGDAKFMSIAAASVLAKTYRDDYMEKIHKENPQYFWNKNKGYPTKQHRQAIRDHGVTQHHRKSFRLLPEQLKLGS